jgi:hypothetical protein
MENAALKTDQRNHSNHRSRQAPRKLLAETTLRMQSWQESGSHQCHSFGPSRGQGTTTHSIPRGGRLGSQSFVKGSIRSTSLDVTQPKG